MSINRGINKEDVVHTYNGISLSYKKEENNSICIKKNRLRDCLTEWSKSDREQQMSYITYMQNLTKSNKKREIIQMNLFTKQKDSHRCKTNLWLPVRKGERNKSGNWDWHINRTIYKIDN